MGDTGTTSFLDQAGIEPTLRPAKRLRRFLTKDPLESDLSRRRFRLRPGPARTVFSEAEKSYVFGFNAVMSEEVEKVEEIPADRRSFAYEGAAAASTILDLLTLSRGRRLHELLAGPARHHRHAAYLGAGRGYALLRLRPVRGARQTHPLLRWLAVDGFGFQQGLVRTDRMVGERTMPDLLTRAHCAVFDQGLGRLLWYHDGAAPDDVAARIGGFAAGRRADLWSGVGFAAAYTGGAEPDELWWLTEHAAADGFRAHLAQGCVFAVAARLRSGPLPEHTEQAVSVLAGADAEEVASWTDQTLIELGHEARTHDDFRGWQSRIRQSWARSRRRANA
ncbi:DUF1702 family protein [Actinomadura sp. ATCC 31491]|uniref:DUF1702 family protein n=1 Tax=Actinomadura luzonensis TaxID=2805427 RepID=A0ABT0FKQ8_9ACTN|nr:DUF1702 family protein [Actinomadura luzonensis]MCK2212890.1 DUF1702 family protein [Actinomadura luzonensis]